MNFEDIYIKYNRREFVNPDPLQFLYKYSEIKDCEIVAIIASSLAYGRVAQILKSVNSILIKMNPSPYEYILNGNKTLFTNDFSTFKHRFTTGAEIVFMLMAIQKSIKKYSTIENAFMDNYKDEDENIIPALEKFVKILTEGFPKSTTYLFPSPKKGSACKRLMLFLRWLIRKDSVDLGCWKQIPTSKLIIPLDTHMHQIAILLKLTSKKQPNLKTAIEITNAFKIFSYDDPVKYDFSLTRFGIRDELSYEQIKNY